MSLEEILEEKGMFNKKKDFRKLVRTDLKDRGEGKVEIIPFGDVHFGHKTVDKELLKEQLYYMYDKPNLYVLGMGDLIEASTVSSVGGGIFEQEEFVQQQYEDMADMLKPLKKKIIGLHAGNHEKRIYKHSGLDVTKLLCRELDCKYLGDATLHYWKLGKQQYSAFSFHGTSGARTVGGKLNAIRRVGSTYDVDMVLMGHVHDLMHTTEDLYTVLGNNPVVKRKHYIITGSYLGFWGSYAQSKGYNPGQLGSPKIKLKKSEKSIRVSL